MEICKEHVKREEGRSRNRTLWWKQCESFEEDGGCTEEEGGDAEI